MKGQQQETNFDHLRKKHWLSLGYLYIASDFEKIEFLYF